MYFKNMLLNKYKNRKLIIFVDMDGVIADYNFNNNLDFKHKRPLNTNINELYELSMLENVELHILSICKQNYQIREKNDWLNKYAPFFLKENRTIISKENNINMSSRQLKYNFLNEFKVKEKETKVIVIDDDNDVLKYLLAKLNYIDFYQDSSIID